MSTMIGIPVAVGPVRMHIAIAHRETWEDTTMSKWLTHINLKSLGVMIALLAFVVAASSCSSDSVSGPPANAGDPTGSFTRMSQRDTDGDGILDVSDSDDDNDGIDDDEDVDDDNDGILDEDEQDSDDDGILDDNDDDYVELKGKITSMGTNSFVAYGFTVLTDDDTRIEGDNHEQLQFSDLSVGTFVEVEGILNDDSTILAREVEIEDESGDDNGDDGDGEDVALSAVSVGDFVEAKGVDDGQGGWRLTDLHFEWEHDRFEYSGELASIGGGALTLLGIDFVVPDGIRFEDETDMGKTMADLEAGDYVEVYAMYNEASDTYTATRVKLEDQPETFAKVEAEVFAVDAEGGTITVGGVTFHE
jgi:hypothetical protein